MTDVFVIGDRELQLAPELLALLLERERTGSVVVVCGLNNTVVDLGELVERLQPANATPTQAVFNKLAAYVVSAPEPVPVPLLKPEPAQHVPFYRSLPRYKKRR